MTLEESSRAIFDAVEAGHLAALETASEQRREVLATLALMPQTPPLLDAIIESIKAGEAATQAIRRIRQHAREEIRRLTDIEQGFVRTQLDSSTHYFDYRG